MRELSQSMGSIRIVYSTVAMVWRLFTRDFRVQNESVQETETPLEAPRKFPEETLNLPKNRSQKEAAALISSFDTSYTGNRKSK